MGLRARTLHEAVNLLVFTNCSNAFNTVKSTAVLAGVAYCVPALTPLVAQCYGTRPADVLFRMDSGETRTIACSSEVQQADPGNVLSGVATGAEAFQREICGRSGSLRVHGRCLSCLIRFTANTIRAFASFRRELDYIGIVIKPVKTVAPTPKGHAPTTEEIRVWKRKRPHC